MGGQGAEMNVAVVVYGDKSHEKLLKIARALSRGIASQGHHVDVIDGRRETDKKLTFYEYLALGSENTHIFGGKIPEGVANYLAQSGSMSGKRCFAFVLKKGLRPMKTLQRLMKCMEAEGMFIKLSEVLSKEQDAEEIGKRLQIAKKMH